MTLKKTLIVAVAALSCQCLGSTFAHDGSAKSPAAGQDDENATLARLVHELDALVPLVSEAENKALLDTRVRLNYGWLRRDLELVRSGIEWHLNTPSTEPRSFEPLKGDYRY